MSTTTTPDLLTAPRTRVAWGVLKAAPAVAIAVAIVTEAIAWFFVWSMSISAEFTPLRFGNAALASAIAALAAAIVLVVLVRVSKTPAPWFIGLASLAFAFSIVPIIGLMTDATRIPGTDGAALSALLLEHFFAFAIIVPTLYKAAKL